MEHARTEDYVRPQRPLKREERMYDLLIKAIAPIALVIKDDSAKHAGHAAMKGVGQKGESHYHVEIVADRFKGLSRVARHQLVYDALKPEFDDGMHALAIKAMTVDEL